MLCRLLGDPLVLASSQCCKNGPDPLDVFGYYAFPCFKMGINVSTQKCENSLLFSVDQSSNVNPSSEVTNLSPSDQFRQENTCILNCPKSFKLVLDATISSSFQMSLIDEAAHDKVNAAFRAEQKSLHERRTLNPERHIFQAIWHGNKQAAIWNPMLRFLLRNWQQYTPMTTSKI